MFVLSTPARGAGANRELFDDHQSRAPRWSIRSRSNHQKSAQNIIMSILGAVVRARPSDVGVVVARLATLPGVDVAINPGDGRLVLVLEDAEVDGTLQGAGATLAAIAAFPEVLNTSLVYEYSGDEPADAVTDYRAWRGSLGRKRDTESDANPPSPA